MLKYEQDARKVYEGAVDFRAVSTGLRRTIVGWTFHVPRNMSEECGNDGYSWVTLDGDVPCDTYRTEGQAASAMKAHLRMKRQRPVDEMGKRA